jgi:pyruvate/2-oxoglutarate dehydrogenase complex dihydrolipoamide acyltransferase (E2) component
MGDEAGVDAVAGSETRHRLTRLQRAMVKTMSNAVSVAALSQVTRAIDMSSVIQDRDERPDRPSINTYIMAAVAGRLGSHPMLNGRLEGREVVVPDHVNLGVAVSVREGLVVPIVHGADRLSFTELGEALAVAAGKARDNKLTFDDIEGGTFTVSNLGMFGIDGGFAIPPQPQGAILLVGRVRDRFVPDDEGQPTLRSLCSFGLTFDHRFIDGAAASALLADVAAALADAGALIHNTGRPA